MAAANAITNTGMPQLLTPAMLDTDTLRFGDRADTDPDPHCFSLCL